MPGSTGIRYEQPRAPGVISPIKCGNHTGMGSRIYDAVASLISSVCPRAPGSNVLNNTLGSYYTVTEGANWPYVDNLWRMLHC